ncbi:MAG: RNA ligase [Flavobacterium sp.]|uniref:RNA ligase n=1 Tax=Flavobacterium sp. TaxID=239 RepID=UPI00260F5A5C|nr:RNA ligase [Flavobacterium sp.]MDD5150683.1 RNA ligase [Flavobacterium sp.]
MNVIEYINKNSLQQLISTYNLRANYHRDYPNLVQLCYHQLDTPKNPITNNCRGIIIDTDNNSVVSFPFTRFGDYNYLNPKENSVDFDNCRFYEKIDGSIITMYWYADKWNISTKGLPDASGLIYGIEKTYNDYFWEVFDKLGYHLPTDIDHCYIFEFKFPSDNFLVKTNEETIKLIGIRNLITMQEVDIYLYNDTQYCPASPTWYRCEYSELENINEILNHVRTVDPLTFEGYVACDKNFNRVKIKSPQYESINLLSDINKKDNKRRLLDIIRTNNHKNFLLIDKYECFTEEYKVIKEKFNNLKNLITNLYNDSLTLSGKELGLKLKKWPELSGLIFSLKNKNFTSVDDLLYNIDIKKLERLVGK